MHCGRTRCRRRAQWISRAIFARTRSASSNQLRKSQQASSSRCAKCCSHGLRGAARTAGRRSRCSDRSSSRAREIRARTASQSTLMRIPRPQLASTQRTRRRSPRPRPRESSCAAVDHFHLSLRQLLADRDAVRNADQVGILELHARPLVAIVEQRVQTHACGRSRRSPAAASRCAASRVVHRRDHHIETARWRRAATCRPCRDTARWRRVRMRSMPMPYDPMIGVTSSPASFEHAQPHRLRILVAQLEDVADLDALDQLRAVAPQLNARVARGHLPQIEILGLEILAGRDVPQVVVVLVRARDHVAAAFQGLVGNDAHVCDADRTQRARHRRRTTRGSPPDAPGGIPCAQRRAANFVSLS